MRYVPHLPLVLLLLCGEGFGLGAEPATDCMLSQAHYQGWQTQRLANGLVELHVVPQLGGRVMQFQCGDREFLWVNPQLAGKLSPPSGLKDDGSWLNYGGDKLWPAPQGWDNDEQWPGPPDAVLDGQPYTFESLPGPRDEVAVRLTSGKDPRSGIQFSRVIRVFEDSSRVHFVATMTNVDTKPRRWGIWAHTQLDAAKADGSSFNPLMQAWCPLHPQSHFPNGFHVIFGAQDNPSFQPDLSRGLMRVQYQYQVGKIGLDSPAGWVATVDGASGAVFVQRFVFEPQAEYPDGSSVEFWLNGIGTIHAYNKDTVMADSVAENPYVFESEVLSPFARLEPGQSYSWSYDWYAANIGGDFPVVDCTSVGVVAQPLSATVAAGQVSLQGRFGVFVSGTVRAEFCDAAGQSLQSLDLRPAVSPRQPLVLDAVVAAPAAAALVKLVVRDERAKLLGELARCELQLNEAAARWPVEQVRAWYDKQPWLVGCNFLPSTAVNDVEMWQAETFDPVTIDRELGWAQDLGFNTVRVFLNYVVWEADAAGLKRRFQEFLQIADRHGISVMPILFDDCNFAGRIAATGRQPDPVPGVHNSQWVSSPPLAMVTDRSAWPHLERYVKDLVGTFGQDRRIVVWDLYNEPGNGMDSKSQPLMEAAFAWAREMKPIQPLTTGAWTDFSSPFSHRIMELSDVVSFHGYDSVPELEAKLKTCAAQGRPVLCTEWLVRRGGNSFEQLLPLFRDRKIGCWNWGLVAGRTQTYFPWGSPPNAPEPKRWQHDILRADGTPFNAREVQFIKVTTGKLPASALPRRTVLVPTAEKSPVPWRFTVEKPADDWFQPDFDDTAWQRGAAPFGTEEPPFARKPNTAWTGADLWLRREFELPPGQFADLTLLLHYDEDATVYINGVLAVKASGYNAAYEPFDIAPEAQATLKPGRNAIAVHCHQTGGGQYCDLGIDAVVEK